MSIVFNPECQKLLKEKPVELVFVGKTGLFSFGQGEYEVRFKGRKVGKLANDKELVKFCNNMFNAAFTCGASSGIAYSSAFKGNVLEKENYSDLKPYEAKLYTGLDHEYEYTVFFEDTPIQSLANISATGLSAIIGFMNDIYQYAYKDGVDLTRRIYQTQNMGTESPGM